jgi:hypothetical protein
MKGGAMLQIWDVDWSLDEAQCPCDIHLVEWLRKTGVEGASLFHFGTGGHHHVGLDNLERGSPNDILGITASPKEFQTFIKLAIERPRLSRCYQVLFGDIYLLNTRLLPRFDVVTLFHLCEFRGDSQDAYGALTDREVVDRLLGLMAPGGRIMFFAGSFAYDKAEAIAGELVREGALGPAQAYKSLRIHTKLA